MRPAHPVASRAHPQSASPMIARGLTCRQDSSLQRHWRTGTVEGFRTSRGAAAASDIRGSVNLTRLAAARNGLAATMVALLVQAAPALADDAPNLILPLLTAIAFASAAR